MGLFKPAWSSKDPKKVVKSLQKKFGYGFICSIPPSVVDQIAPGILDIYVCEHFEMLTIGVRNIDYCFEQAEKCPPAYIQLAYATILRTLLDRYFMPYEDQTGRYPHYLNIVKVYEKITDDAVRKEADESYWMTNPPSKMHYEWELERRQEMADRQRKRESMTTEEKKAEQDAYVEYKQELERENYHNGGN